MTVRRVARTSLNTCQVLLAGHSISSRTIRALVGCRERPKQRPLVCFDERLRAAATRLGSRGEPWIWPSGWLGYESTPSGPFRWPSYRRRSLWI